MTSEIDPFHAVILWSIAGILLLVIATVARRVGRSATPYLLLLAINLLTALGALHVTKLEPVLYLVSVGLFCALVVLPAFIDAWARWAVQHGKLALAERLVALRRLLQPGMGLDRDGRMLGALRLVDQGRAEEALRFAYDQLGNGEIDDATRLELLQRIMTISLFEHRPQDAIALFEREDVNLLAGRSPAICSLMVRAYAEVDDLDTAVRCQSWLEQSKVTSMGGNPALINTARLTLLAHLGQVAQVERILELPGFLPTMSRTRRALWLGVAESRAGRAAQAQQRWTELVEQQEDPHAARAAAWRLQQPPGPMAGRPDATDESLLHTVVNRALSYGAMPLARGRYWQTAPVSTVLLVAMLVIYALSVYIGRLYGQDGEAWMLLRMGANFAPTALSSEPWRLITSMFLHGGAYHLAFNAYALYLLGRLTEQMFGSARMWTIYGLSGIAGSAASSSYAAGVLSVGASGAIFGLLGAFAVGLHGLRGRVPEGWRRRLSINLLVVIGLQLGIGLLVPVIDNAAHIGGLVGGAAVAFVLRPAAVDGDRSWRRILSLAIGLVLAGLTLVSGVYALRAGPAETLASIPRRRIGAKGLEVSCPTHWVRLTEQGGDLALQDPLLPTSPTLRPLLVEPLASSRESWSATAQMHDLVVVDQLRRMESVTDARLLDSRPVAVSAQVYRSRVRLRVGQHRIHQLNYFKRDGDRLIMLFARLPAGWVDVYRPLLDDVVQSAHLSY